MKRQLPEDMPPTARQLEIVDFIRWHTAEHGVPPTFREIGVFLGIKSTNGVADHIASLIRKGFVRQSAGRARAIVLTSKAGPTTADRLDRMRRALRAAHDAIDALVAGRDDAAALVAAALDAAADPTLGVNVASRRDAVDAPSTATDGEGSATTRG